MLIAFYGWILHLKRYQNFLERREVYADNFIVNAGNWKQEIDRIIRWGRNNINRTQIVIEDCSGPPL